jgi:hypothetical protein
MTALGADANVGIVLAAKGSGPLTASLPDNALTGGNARGTNAVDWQSSRTAATQVASGTTTVIAGGQNNTASGSGAALGGGQSNLASGALSVVAGGMTNTADGARSWVPGGERGTTRGHYGRGAWSSGFISAMGDAQAGEFLLRRQTTTATVTRLTADNGNPGAANTLNLPNASTYRIKLLVIARQIAGTAGTAGDSASWDIDAMLRRGANAAATVLVSGRTSTSALGLAAITAGTGVAPAMNDSAAAAWRLTLDADTTNGGIAISGTGEANKTVNWVARVLSVEAVG